MGERTSPLEVGREIFLDAVCDHLVQPFFAQFAHAALMWISTCPILKYFIISQFSKRLMPKGQTPK
jgi:hypothetical protein